MNSSFSKARISKDTNYDGRFFFGVKTTGVFCRPSCPAPEAKEENVLYFDTMFDALNKGYRPCRRCRPDLSIEYYNSNISGTLIVKEALNKIYEGFLNENSISDLAAELKISDRHLRKVFIDNLGIPPVKAANYHKALFAKKLLSFTKHSITDIALSSGFNSIRQFNDVFKSVFGRTPSEVKKKSENNDESGTILILNYHKNFCFSSLLSFMRPRLIKGIETADDISYSRTFRIKSSSLSNSEKITASRGYFTVKDNPGKSALELSINTDNIKCCMELYYRVRKMFDMDTDYSQINKAFSDDPVLSRGMDNETVPGLPVAFNTFEFTVRAVLGQQVTVKAATTLAARIAEKTAVSTPDDYPEGLDYYFPDPDELINTDLEGLGITKTRQKTIKTITDALIRGCFSLSRNQNFYKFEKDFTALKGIGSWTANYVAMRGLGMADSFTAGDLGIIKALEKDGKRLTEKEIEKVSEKWRPWRAYAALCLWNIKPEKASEEKPAEKQTRQADKRCRKLSGNRCSSLAAVYRGN